MNEQDGKKQGVLYVVATPIGNLEDITLRALRILKEVDLIAAEDTRHTRILLNAYDIKTPLVSLHEHNEKERSVLIVTKLASGMNVAYVSDAGTPCISDPGYHLVDVAFTNNIRVIPVPGPSAVIAALSVCGLPADQFFFCGFLPPKEGKRRRFLEMIKNIESTLVFYESPARILDALSDINDILGDRQIVLVREATKVFEDIRRGRASELAHDVSGVKSRGEFTVVVQGAVNEPLALSDDDIRAKLTKVRKDQTLSLRDAVAAVTSETGLPRKKIYDLAVKIHDAHSQD